MTFLPIVARELSVASRRGKSYWIRLLTAAIGMAILAGALWFSRLGWRWNSAVVFHFIAWYAFTYVLLAGAMATADCLSEEKRENTAGLLFLTDLKGYDIILGKLVATSVTCTFGLLALLPVLAIPLLMGGVRFSDFWRIALNLGITLFLSMAMGLLVSACSRQAFRATGSALCLMVGLGFGLPLLSQWVQSYLHATRVGILIAILSPFHAQAFATATIFGGGLGSFWWSVSIAAALGLVLLGGACLVWPRTWREEPAGDGSSRLLGFFRAAAAPRSPVPLLNGPTAIQSPPLSEAAMPLRQTMRVRRGAAVADANPFAWLAGLPSRRSWIVLAGAALVMAVGAWLTHRFASSARLGYLGDQLLVWIWVAILLHAAVVAKLSSAAAQRFGEDRVNGSLELVLGTPLTVRQILSGHARALWGQTGSLMLLALLAHGLILWHVLLFALEETGGSAPSVFHLFVVDLKQFLTVQQGPGWETGFGIAAVLAAGLAAIAHWITLANVSAWLALRLRRPRFAPWAALVVVFVPPWPCFVFTLIGLLEFESAWTEARWFALVLELLLGFHLTSDAVLCLWARHQLHSRFRPAVTDRTLVFPPLTARRVWFSFGLPIAAIITAISLLIAAFHAEENWRGHRAWNKLERSLITAGAPPALSALAPLPVAPEQNFAEAPLLAELFRVQVNPPSQQLPRRAPIESLRSVSMDLSSGSHWAASERNWMIQKPSNLEGWRNIYRAGNKVPTNGPPQSAADDILLGLSRYETLLDELETESVRPYCRYPHSYLPDWNVDLPHWGVLSSVSEVLRFRAAAELAAGKSDQAFRDVTLCLRLAETLKDEPFFQSQLLRTDLVMSVLQPIWDGLARGCWADWHIRAFQDRLSELALLSDFPLACRAEAIHLTSYWAFHRAARQHQIGPQKLTHLFFPEGWTYLNQVRVYQLLETKLVSVIDVPAHRAFPAKAALPGWDKETAFPRWKGPEIRDAPQNFARGQVALDLAVTACALEQFRRDRGVYPDSLQALVPTYLPKVRTDIIDGKPLRYRRLDRTRFLLYSLGWDEIDGGGSSRSDADWVWSYPSLN